MSKSAPALALGFMVRIHANAKAHDKGETTNEYPPYLIKDDSEYDAATNSPSTE